MTDFSEDQILQLPFWKGPVRMDSIDGGITNKNFVVSDSKGRYFVRLGEDIPLHGVMRFNELQASRAAAKIGLSPEVLHHAPGALVLRFIEGTTLRPEDVRQEAYLTQIIDMLGTCHREMKRAVRGPALIFWAFHVISDYIATLREDRSRMVAILPDLLKKSEELEGALGPVEIAFCHNDLLAANFIHDGQRLWLIDWDYAGYNSPLFDLANLAANNELSEDQEVALLARYQGRVPDPTIRVGFAAMKCASALRETLWSMVSEIHSQIEFDFEAYTDENLERFEHQWSLFKRLAQTRPN